MSKISKFGCVKIHLRHPHIFDDYFHIISRFMKHISCNRFLDLMIALSSLHVVVVEDGLFGDVVGQPLRVAEAGGDHARHARQEAEGRHINDVHSQIGLDKVACTLLGTEITLVRGC